MQEEERGIKSDPAIYNANLPDNRMALLKPLTQKA